MVGVGKANCCPIAPRRYVDTDEGDMTAGIDLSYKVRSTIDKVNRESSALLQLLNKHYDEPDVVNVAFQWAESPTEVFLAVKFSNRWSSPGLFYKGV